MDMTTAKKLAPFGKGLLGAFVGGLLLLAGLHIYADHQALHQVIGFLNANSAKLAALK